MPARGGQVDAKEADCRVPGCVLYPIDIKCQWGTQLRERFPHHRALVVHRWECLDTRGQQLLEVRGVVNLLHECFVQWPG